MSKHKISDVPEPLYKAFKSIVDYQIADPDITKEEKESYTDTPVRAAKAFMEICKPISYIKEHLEKELSTGFPVHKSYGNDILGMVFQGPIQAYSYCPHHFLPVDFKVYVTYIPTKKGIVLGLSKLTRIVTLLSSRPVLQEQLAIDIADTLFKREKGNFPSIESEGSAVLVVGKHGCMACRGVRQDHPSGSLELRGSFWNSDLEKKFYMAIEALDRHK